MGYAKAKHFDPRLIPVIDITPLRDGTDPIGVSKSLHEASQNIGFIYIKGNVGQNSIQRMRRGNVIINGNLGDYACEEMISGSVIVMGRVGNSFAEGIKRGTIITKEKKLVKETEIPSGHNPDKYVVEIGLFDYC